MEDLIKVQTNEWTHHPKISSEFPLSFLREKQDKQGDFRICNRPRKVST